MTVSSDPTSATLVIDWVHTIVTLSGTVTIGSDPAAGAAVDFDGLSTTTDANGNYTLHPSANSSGGLTVTKGPYSSTTSVTLGSSDQIQDVNIPSSGSIVTLSGTVLVGSNPAANATVTLGGLTTTTDANGNYVLQPIAGTSGTISVVDGVFAGDGYYASAPITIGQTDQTDDITIPSSFTTGTVNVVDQDGKPLAGVPITGAPLSSPSPVPGTTSDGSTVTWGYGPTGNGPPPPTQPLCTTNSAGTCTFTTLLNVSGTLTATYSSPYGSDPSYPSVVRHQHHRHGHRCRTH